MSPGAGWAVVLVTGVLAYALKFLGHVAPSRWFAHPRLRRINDLVPVVLLAALVVAQGLAAKSHVVLDHRLAGLGAAAVALWRRAPFPVVVLAAAVTSALVVRLGG